MAKAFDITLKFHAQAANIRPAVDSIKSQLKDAGTNLNLDKVSTKGLQSIAPELHKLQTQAQQVANTINNGIGNVKAYNSLKKQINDISRATNKLKSDLNFNQTGEHIHQVTDSMEKFGHQIVTAGRRYSAFLIGGIAVVRLGQSFRQAVTESIEFQHNMVRLSQLGEVTAKEIQHVERTITNLSTSLGVSSKELAQVSIYLKGAGLSIKEVEAALAALAKTSLAPTFKDIRSTTEGLLSLRAQFKLGAEDYEKVLGSINQVAKDFAAESEDIVEAVKRAGGAFVAASGDFNSPQKSLNEFIGLFTAVRSTTRESADTIATAFRTIFARLQSNTVNKNLKEMGINLRYTAEEARQAGQNIEGQFVGGFNAIQRISKAVKNIPTTDPRYASVVQEIGGIRQISKVIPLLQQTETATKAYQAALFGTTSLTGDAEKAQSALAVRLTTLKESFAALVREVQSNKQLGVFVNTMITAATAATELARALTPLIPLLSTLAAINLTRASFSVAKGAYAQFTRPGKFATGGVVGNVNGGANSDSVSMMAPAGAFVIRRPQARKLSPSMVRYLTSDDGRSTGGMVPIRAMPGEIIVPPAKAAAMGGALHQFNKGYASGGILPRVRPFSVRLSQFIKNQGQHEKTANPVDASISDVEDLVFSLFPRPGKSKNQFIPKDIKLSRVARKGLFGEESQIQSDNTFTDVDPSRVFSTPITRKQVAARVQLDENLPHFGITQFRKRFGSRPRIDLDTSPIPPNDISRPSILPVITQPGKTKYRRNWYGTKRRDINGNFIVDDRVGRKFHGRSGRVYNIDREALSPAFASGGYIETSNLSHSMLGLLENYDVGNINYDKTFSKLFFTDEHNQVFKKYNANGLFFPGKKHIVVKSRKGNYDFNTLIHELTHAVDFGANYGSGDKFGYASNNQNHPFHEVGKQSFRLLSDVFGKDITGHPGYGQELYHPEALARAVEQFSIHKGVPFNKASEKAFKAVQEIYLPYARNRFPLKKFASGGEVLSNASSNVDWYMENAYGFFMRSKHRHDVAKHLPEGSEFLAHGTDAVVFKTPDNKVVRVGGIGMSRNYDDTSKNRPNHPLMLQAEERHQYGQYVVEKLPYAPDLTQTVASYSRRRRIEKAFRNRLIKLGKQPIDVLAQNLARVNKKIVGIDPELFSDARGKIDVSRSAATTEHVHQRTPVSHFLNASFAMGGMVNPTGFAEGGELKNDLRYYQPQGSKVFVPVGVTKPDEVQTLEFLLKNRLPGTNRKDFDAALRGLGLSHLAPPAGDDDKTYDAKLARKILQPKQEEIEKRNIQLGRRGTRQTRGIGKNIGSEILSQLPGVQHDFEESENAKKRLHAELLAEEYTKTRNQKRRAEIAAQVKQQAADEGINIRTTNAGLKNKRLITGKKDLLELPEVKAYLETYYPNQLTNKQNRPLINLASSVNKAVQLGGYTDDGKQNEAYKLARHQAASAIAAKFGYQLSSPTYSPDINRLSADVVQGTSTPVVESQPTVEPTVVKKSPRERLRAKTGITPTPSPEPVIPQPPVHAPRPEVRPQVIRAKEHAAQVYARRNRGISVADIRAAQQRANFPALTVLSPDEISQIKEKKLPARDSKGRFIKKDVETPALLTPPPAPVIPTPVSDLVHTDTRVNSVLAHASQRGIFGATSHTEAYNAIKGHILAGSPRELTEGGTKHAKDYIYAYKAIANEIGHTTKVTKNEAGNYQANFSRTLSEDELLARYHAAGGKAFQSIADVEKQVQIPNITSKYGQTYILNKPKVEGSNTGVTPEKEALIRAVGSRLGIRVQKQGAGLRRTHQHFMAEDVAGYKDSFKKGSSGGGSGVPPQAPPGASNDPDDPNQTGRKTKTRVRVKPAKPQKATYADDFHPFQYGNQYGKRGPSAFSGDSLAERQARYKAQKELERYKKANRVFQDVSPIHTRGKGFSMGDQFDSRTIIPQVGNTPYPLVGEQEKLPITPGLTSTGETQLTLNKYLQRNTAERLKRAAELREQRRLNPNIDRILRQGHKPTSIPLDDFDKPSDYDHDFADPRFSSSQAVSNFDKAEAERKKSIIRRFLDNRTKKQEAKRNAQTVLGTKTGPATDNEFNLLDNRNTLGFFDRLRGRKSVKFDKAKFSKLTESMQKSLSDHLNKLVNGNLEDYNKILNGELNLVTRNKKFTKGNKQFSGEEIVGVHNPLDAYNRPGIKQRAKDFIGLGEGGFFPTARSLFTQTRLVAQPVSIPKDQYSAFRPHTPNPSPNPSRGVGQFARIGGAALGVALGVGSQFLPQAIEHVAGTIEKPGAGGVAGAKLGQQISGTIVGAGYGAFAGGFAGGPVGALFGGAAGALAGFITATKDAEKQLQTLDFEKAFSKLDTSIADVLSGKKTVTGDISQSIIAGLKTLDVGERNQNGADANPTSRYASRQQFIKENITPRLGQLTAFNENLARNIKIDPSLTRLANINDNAEITNKRSARLAEFNKQGGGEIAQRIVEATPGLTLEKYYQEIDKVILESAKQRQQTIATTKAMNNLENQIVQFTRIDAAITSTVVSINNLQHGLNSLEATINGTLQATPNVSHAGNLTFGNINNKAFSNSVDYVTQTLQSRQSNPYVSSLGSTAKNINAVTSLLPGVIANAASSTATEGEGVRGRIVSGLRSSNVSKEITDKIEEVLDGIDEKDIAKAASDNIQKLADKLIKDGFANINEVLTNAAKALEDRANQFNADLIKNQQIINKIGESQDKYRTLQINEAKSAAVFAAELSGRSGQSHLTTSTQLEPIQRRQERLTGLTGDNANNPRLIGDKLRNTHANIKALTEIRDESSGKEQELASQALAELQNRAQNLTKALEELADPVQKNAILQEKLNRIDEDRNSRLSFTEKLATATPGDLVRMQRNAFSADLATRQGSLVGLNRQQREGALEHLSSLGDATLEGYGNRKASDIRQSLIKNTGLQLGILSPESERQRLGVVKQINSNDKTAVAAQEEIIKHEQSLQQQFFTRLEQIQNEFFNKLTVNLAEATKKDVEGKLSQNTTQLGKANQSNVSKILLNNKFGLSTQQIQAVRGANIQPLADTLAESKGLHTRFESVKKTASFRGYEKLLEPAFGNIYNGGDVNENLKKRDEAQQNLAKRLSTNLGLPQEYTPKILETFNNNASKFSPNGINGGVPRDKQNELLQKTLTDLETQRRNELATNQSDQLADIHQKVFGGTTVNPVNAAKIQNIATNLPVIDKHLKNVDEASGLNVPNLIAERSQLNQQLDTTNNQIYLASRPGKTTTLPTPEKANQYGISVPAAENRLAGARRSENKPIVKNDIIPKVPPIVDSQLREFEYGSAPSVLTNSLLKNNSPALSARERRRQRAANTQANRTQTQRFTNRQPNTNVPRQSVNNNTNSNAQEFIKATSNLDKTINNMSETLNALAAVFKGLNIPDKITVENNGRQEVVINGAQLLAALTGDVAKLAKKDLLAQFSSTINNTIKDAPPV